MPIHAFELFPYDLRILENPDVSDYHYVMTNDMTVWRCPSLNTYTRAVVQSAIIYIPMTADLEILELYINNVHNLKFITFCQSRWKQ